MSSLKIGFSTQKYLKAQEAAIRERLSFFKTRLYLEVGGKLYADFHAARTLPGYEPDTKLFLLKNLKKDIEIIFCVSVKQLTLGKLRGDLGMGYDQATILALNDLNNFGFRVKSVVINRYSGEEKARVFKKQLERLGFRVYFRFEIEGYPQNLDLIISNEGYGKDEYIVTEKPLVVVWGPGPGSGKMSTCLGQIYQEQKKGFGSGYAKFETFPIWNLPVDHPVNLAYEAAAADLGDYNLVDPYHLSAFRKVATNYNRDVESFPILLSIIQKIMNKRNFMVTYRSPTDMGINRIKDGIINDDLVIKAAKKEIIFYLFRYRQEYQKGLVDENVLLKMEQILEKLKLSEEDLLTVRGARGAAKEAQKSKDKGERGVYCGAAIELKNGKIISGKNSPLLHAEAACILNAIKFLAKIPDEIDLLSPRVIKSMNQIKSKILKEKSRSLEVNEVLTALAVSSPTNPTIQKALRALGELKGCYLHTTHLPFKGDETTLRKLGIWVSTDGKYASQKLNLF